MRRNKSSCALALWFSNNSPRTFPSCWCECRVDRRERRGETIDRPDALRPLSNICSASNPQCSTLRVRSINLKVCLWRCWGYSRLLAVVVAVFFLRVSAEIPKSFTLCLILPLSRGPSGFEALIRPSPHHLRRISSSSFRSSLSICAKTILSLPHLPRKGLSKSPRDLLLRKTASFWARVSHHHSVPRTLFLFV